MDRARLLSDLHSPGVAPFRLRASFSFVGAAFATVEGTYTEVWVSTSRWRKEIAIKDEKRIEVGGLRKRWILETSNFPEIGARIPGILFPFTPDTSALEFVSVSEQPLSGLTAECAFTKPDSRLQLHSAFCFDKRSGVLVQKAVPQVRLRNIVSNDCEYGSFLRFGGHSVPHEVACFEDRHRKLDAKLIELSSEPSPELGLFTPPPGSIELGQCPVKMEPPRAVHSPSPQWPQISRDQSSQVLVSLVVDEKGKPRNVKVENSAGTRVDRAAVSAVSGWQFKPATCEGEPMSTMLNVQVDFRLYQ